MVLVCSMISVPINQMIAWGRQNIHNLFVLSAIVTTSRRQCEERYMQMEAFFHAGVLDTFKRLKGKADERSFRESSSQSKTTGTRNQRHPSSPSSTFAGSTRIHRGILNEQKLPGRRGRVEHEALSLILELLDLFARVRLSILRELQSS